MKQFFLLLSFLILLVMNQGFSQDHNITFRLDMNDYSGAYATIYVNGTFNDWCGDCDEMTDPDMDGIYEVTLPIPAGGIRYQFRRHGDDGSFAGQEYFTGGGQTCTITDNNSTFRYNYIDTDEILPIVTWNTCVDVGPGPFNVTFAVNMNDYAGPFTYTAVYVKGTFNDWCSGSCDEMTDVNGDGVYKLTLPLDPGSFEYVFSLDVLEQQSGQEENITPGLPCTINNDGFTNRFHVNQEDAVLDAVCWNICEICNISCPAPINVGHTLDAPARCHITWDPAPGALRYDVLYRVKGTTDWSRVGALNNYRTLRFLDPMETYQYRVRSFCGDGWDFASATGIREFNMTNIAQNRENVSTDIIGINPNPVREVLNVDFSTESKSDVSFSIVDMVGKIVYQNTVNNIEGFQNEAIDVSSLPQGYYMLVMQSGDKKVVKKFATVR